MAYRSKVEAAADTARTRFDLEANIRRIEGIYASLTRGCDSETAEQIQITNC
jgi:hypothetical protein